MIARLAMAAVAPVALLAAAGCGGGGSGSEEPPASVAPPDSLVFAELKLRPIGELKMNADAISERVTGYDDLGEFILSRLEKEPDISWLGEEAGVYVTRYEGERPSRGGLILQSTDREAAREFIDETARGHARARNASYDGVDFKVDENSAAGLVGDLVVVTEDAAGFRDVIDASEGESLSARKRYRDAIEGVADGSLADLYVDLGAMLAQSDAAVDPQALRFLRLAGLGGEDATMVGSLIPHGDEVEIDITATPAGRKAASGNASDAVATFPADSVAAAGIPEFGEQLETAIDGLDQRGIPGELGRGELKRALRAAGIDLEGLGSSLGDAGVFVEGETKDELGGALIVSAENPGRARETVANVGLLLRESGFPGVTAVGGSAKGFSIRDPEKLGDRPLVVVSSGVRIAIGYGLEPALRGLSSDTPPLSGSPAYKRAVEGLGDTPISGYVDGPSALRLARALAPSDEGDLHEAEPYLEKIGSIAIGAIGQGDRSSTTVIVGLE